MKRVFISYSRDDRAEVEQLVGELKIRGIRTWRDINDLAIGHPIESEIQKAVEDECDAFLVYLSPSVVRKPDYVVGVELKAAFNVNPTISIIPVFRKITIDEAKVLTLPKLGQDITQYHGESIPGSTGNLLADFQKISQRVLKEHIEQYPVSCKDKILHLCTFKHAWPGQEPILELDWVDEFGNGGRLPSPDDWKSRLLPALGDVKSALAGRFGKGAFRIQARARLSAVLALGFAFRLAMDLKIEQETNGKTQEWTTKGAASKQSPLIVQSKPGDINSEKLAVELSVAGRVSSDVDEFIKQTGIRFRSRIQLSLQEPDRNAVRDAQHAFDIADQVFRQIRSIRDGYDIKAIHLFAAIPFGLAVLIGYQLNACPPVQCYEYSNNKYSPSCLLK